jgi:PAS domain S-box-containing protein
MTRDRRALPTILQAIMMGIAALASIGSAGADLATRFTHYSVEHGLSQAAVETIIQDRQGFIWLGTDEGLNRFDGHNFVTYANDKKDPTTLAHNWVWALHEDVGGAIWVGTDGGGLDRLDPLTGRFEHRALATDPAARVVVRAIVEDSKGALWIGTDGDGVFRLDPSTGATQQFCNDPNDAESLSNDHVKALHADDRGHLWIGTDGGGVSRLNLKSNAIERYVLDRRNPEAWIGARIRSIASDVDGALWIGTYEEGLMRLDTRTDEIRRYRHHPNDPRSLSHDSIRILFVDASGSLWIGTDGGGLNRYDPSSDSFEHVRQDPADFNSLSDDHVVSLFQDRGGVIWVGTYVGINTWNPRVGTFATVARRNGGPNELSNNFVTSFVKTADGTLWIGTSGGGLNRMDPRTGTIAALRHSPKDPASLGDDRVFSLAAEPPNGLWIGTRSGGLNHLDATNGRFRRFMHHPGDQGSLSFDGVTSLLRDRSNTLWIGTYLGGLNELDRSATTFRHFRHDDADPSSLCSDRVVAIAEYRAGSLVIGTHGGGICVFDRVRNAFTTYQHNPADPTSLSSNNAWALHVDADDNLWVGTEDGGLNLWRAEARAHDEARFEHYDTTNGLPSPVVYGVLSDAMGDIWVSSNHGLARLHPQTGEVQKYDVSNGLPNNEFNTGAQYRSDAGELYFGGISGFTYFRPESIRTNAHPPQIALTRVQIMSRDVAPTNAIELGYRDQLMTFEYAALDFTAPQRNTYKHRLIGFDEAWVEDGTLHRATYTNLAPGDYAFQVMAANNDGVWSTQPLTLSLRARPPPWATPLAKVGYLLLAFAAMLLTYRSYSRRLAVARQIHATNVQLRGEIEERHAQERALIRERANAQRYLNIVEVMILALDTDGTVRRVNQKGTRVLGYPEDEIIGCNFYERLVPAEIRDRVRQQFQAVAQYDYSESPIITKDGTERLIAWHTTPLPATEDEPRGLLISGADVTQIRQLEQQLRDSQRMDALGTLASGIAHDFNNILTSILGFAQLTQATVAHGSKAAMYLEKLQMSVGRAKGLVQAILTFGRRARQTQRPTSLAAITLEALQLLRPSLPANIEIRTRIDENCGAVLADPTQLHQLVMNLCTNAYQAIGDAGGVLEIVVESHDVGVEEAHSNPVLATGAHVHLRVSDTGAGMDDATRARIFDPFFTTKRPGEGTGLGLAVVHGIVTQLQGTISVTSAPGEGSRFDVLLPRSAEPALVSVSQAGADAGPPPGDETILFVDDEPDVQQSMQGLLELLGYRTLMASNGAEALVRFKQHADEIDLVITDRAMPGMMGNELALALRELRANLPIIMITGGAADAVPVETISRYLHKPFTKDDLGAAIRSAMPRRAAANGD